MKSRNHCFRSAAASTLVISLANLTPLSADENPFQMREVQRSSTVHQRLAHGLRGSCGGRWEGRCGGMMSGMMMGGPMERGLDPAELPDADVAGAKLVTQYCTQCHGLPYPDQHSAVGWPVTVERMYRRMQWMTQNNDTMNIVAPSEAELKTLTIYLQEHASTTQSSPSSDTPTNQ